MSLLDIFRQLVLLLWKNFILRWRAKIRVIVEIIWPLFLFLILVWVRTRELRSFERHCHFVERSLPSNGILPFFRSFICELNYTCFHQPRDENYNPDFTQLTELTYETLELINKPDFISSSSQLVDAVNMIIKQREEASKITRSMSLKQTLIVSETEFENKMQSLVVSKEINSTLINLMLSSNPNFNYLYSNSTSTYTEPLFQFVIFGAPQELINVLYGPDLDLIDTRRDLNKVYDAEWIRSTMCTNDPTYLLRGSNANYLMLYLCSLNDSELAAIFTYISTNMDYTYVKQEVSKKTPVNSIAFYTQLFGALQAANEIRTTFQNSNLAKNRNLSSILEDFQNLNLKKAICGDSILSVFTIAESLTGRLDLNSFNSLINVTNSSVNSLRMLITDQFGDNFNFGNSFRQGMGRNMFSGKEAARKPSKNQQRIDLNQSKASNESSIKRLTLILKSFNNLRKLNESTCPVKRSDSNFDETVQMQVNSTTKSCFCQVMYSLVEGLSQDTGIIFRQIKSLFMGKILYSPDTPVYNELIQRMNSTFRNVDNFGNLVENMATIASEILVNLNLTSEQDILQLEQSLQSIPFFNFTLTNNNVSLKNLFQQYKLTIEALYFTRNLLDCIELNKFEGFSSEEKAIQIGQKLIDKEAFWAALVFENKEIDNKLPKIVKYKIRMNASHTHDTTYTQDRLYYYGPSNCIGCNSYFLFGFIYLQDMLERSIVEMKSNQTQEFGLTAQMTPYPCFVKDKFIRAISRTLPLFMVLAWIYTVSMMVKDIVYEKEKRLKEFMRVMGLTNGTHWLAWFITSFATMYFVTILLAIILKYGKVTTFSEVSVLLAFFCCFTIATITQCFLISVFFNRANLAAVVAGIIYFLFYLPYTILINYSEVIQPWQKFLASLSSTVAFSYGCELIAAFELQTLGLTWKTFYQSPYSNQQSFSMNTVCLILLFDSLLYLVLTWYIETVAPGEYGIPRKWYFPLQPSYWCGHSLASADNSADNAFKRTAKKSNSFFSRLFEKCFVSKQRIIEQSERENVTAKQTDTIEPLEFTERAGIEIDRLHKVYSRGNNHALKGLSLDFYENEISAFLGHNGAGKSTTMHLLIGLYKPTAGTARINGLDIKNSMDQIRKSLGFVPQHNVLFPNLTVKEHLWFYARLKGLDRQSTKFENEKMLDDTGLRPKKNEFSSNLSGGMQRKLSVAIAFAGNSKTVILDEPSAGVDPSGRRSIWDLLFKYRQGRTIVISTHHMDEADVLGDRIAIISNGKLIAHGTSLFLKNKFGRGYYLTFTKKQPDDLASLSSGSSPSRSSTDTADSGAGQSLSSESEQTQSKSNNEMESFEKQQVRNEEEAMKTLDNEQDKAIYEFVKSRIRNAVLVENIGSEMTFSISNKEEYTRTYEKFFQHLENNTNKLGIDSIGISDTTLEEIFIKLAKQPESNTFNSNAKFFGIDFKKVKQKFYSPMAKVVELSEEKAELYGSYTKLRVANKAALISQQFYALLIKRFHRLKRNIKGFFAEIVLPVLFVCLALLVATLSPKITDRPPLELHPWYYEMPNKMFVSKSSALNFDLPFYFANNMTMSLRVNESVQANYEKASSIVDTIINAPGPGTRCMKGHKIIIKKQAEDLRRMSGNKELECEQFDYNYSQNYTVPSKADIEELNRVNYTYTKRSLDCDCSSGFPSCPKSAGGDINFRSIINLKTKDILFDLTGRNISDWIIKTELNKQFFKKRFGGFEFKALSVDTMLTSKLSEMIQKTIDTLSTTFNVSFENGRTFYGTNPLLANETINIWYNTKGYDANVAYLNVLNNALLRYKINLLNQMNPNTNETMDPREHGIVAINHPMSFTKTQFLDQIERRILIDLFVSICIIFALSFIPASFLVFLLEERETNSKQLQFVSGVKPYIYWISNFVWDLINYIVPCILCILIFIIFDVKAYMSEENFPCLISLMLLYGWACIPLMYPLNYLFKIPSTAFVVSSCLNVFIGVVSTMTTTVLSQLGEEEPDLLNINNILKPIFIVLFPHYCLGQGFLEMSILYNTAEARRAFGFKEEYNPFEFKKVGRNLIALSVQGFVFFTLNMLLQYKFFIRFKPTNNLTKLKLPVGDNEDDDVVMERKRILTGDTKGYKRKLKLFKRKEQKYEQNDDDYIKLVNLTKIYKKFHKYKLRRHVAVNAVSLGINKGECFGLIGVNGAGKTTTFKMITGELTPSGGDVLVNGYSISNQIEKVHENIGYCPQTDALIPLLTAREHLVFFARLRGIPERYVNQASEWAMNRVGLNVFADRISGDFSGGNKRKLSTAIALIGNPGVICLDEPTSGMDAKARRLLWNDILSLIKENRVVILTSHSMEECEALCTRLVIMVNGQFKCLGSPQHLKRKFGSGYKLSLRLNNENDKERLSEFMRENFPDAVIQEMHKNLFEYVLPFEKAKLSDIFGKLESNRYVLDLKDYSVNQTTLDQIFVNFAKSQDDNPFESNGQNKLKDNSLSIDVKKLFADEINLTDLANVANDTYQKSSNNRTDSQSIIDAYYDLNNMNKEPEKKLTLSNQKNSSIKPENIELTYL